MMYFAINLIDKTALPQTKTDSSTLQSGFSIFYAIIGAVAILMLVIAGLRYAINGSDPSKTAEAKKMIAYTLVGLAVISLAALIVQFVLKVKP